jgi:ankyrin repeat protein
LSAWCIFTVSVPAADSRLAESILAGRTEEALELIRSGVALDARDARGFSPLIWAAARGNVTVAIELIQRGARINLRGRDGLTAFSVSMQNGHGKIPPLLVRAGADCLPPNSNWRSDLASRSSRAAEFLTEVERLGTTLIRAAESGRQSHLASLLQQGAPTGFLSEGRETALMIAARRNDSGAIRALLRAGARVTDDHIDFVSPLDSPSLSGGTRKLLLSANVAPSLVARGPFSHVNQDLYAAVQRGDVAAVQTALRNGADPNARWGLRPAIVLAAEKNDKALVQLLADAGAKPSLEDIEVVLESGTTAREIIRVLDPAVKSRDDYRRLIGSLSRIITLGSDFQSVDLSESAQWLLNRAESTNGISEDYIQQLEAAVGALESVARADTPAGVRKQTVDEAAADLKAKADHCRVSGIWMGGKVPVSAITRRGSALINNWQVFYLPRIFAHARGVEPHLIPSWTSPARQSIEPGRYRFWAVDPSTGQRSSVVEQSILGRDEVPVIIPLP